MTERIKEKDYWMGRKERYSSELTAEIEASAVELLKSVNALLEEISQRTGHRLDKLIVSSGWRPPSLNATVPNASKKSLHMTGNAVDIADNSHVLYHLIADNADLLQKYGLWLEDIKSAPNWVHLDKSKVRVNRAVRIFLA